MIFLENKKGGRLFPIIGIETTAYCFLVLLLVLDCYLVDFYDVVLLQD